MTRIPKIGFGIAAILVTIPVLYVALAVLCALVPIAGRPQKISLDGAPIYVCSDLVHSDFAIPVHDGNIGWNSKLSEFSAQSLPTDAYLLIGWGDLEFFTEVPTWNDVTFPILFSALAGQGRTAIRVVAINNPADNPECARLALDEEGRVNLLDFVRQELANTTQETTESRYVEYRYSARRYSIFYTCNQWTAEGLSKAGLAWAWFAPFTFSITWPLSSAHL